MMYKISVIVCVYNEGLCLIEALRSIQTNDVYNYTEVIIIDDCSVNPVTSRLLHLLEKFTRYTVIYSKENLGLSNSRNTGFLNASTSYIVPLDADDVLPAYALDRIYQTFTQNPDIDFIVGNYYLKDIQSGETHLIDCGSIATSGIIDIKKLAADWKLLGTSPCKKATWESVNGYDLKYSYSVQDVDFWIRVTMAGNKGLYVKDAIYNWNRSVTGMNMNFNRLDMIKLMEDHRDFYLFNNSRSILNNKIFEAYYPYKQYSILISIGIKYFLTLKMINKFRFLNIAVKNLVSTK